MNFINHHLKLRKQRIQKKTQFLTRNSQYYNHQKIQVQVMKKQVVKREKQRRENEVKNQKTPERNLNLKGKTENKIYISF